MNYWTTIVKPIHGVTSSCFRCSKKVTFGISETYSKLYCEVFPNIYSNPPHIHISYQVKIVCWELFLAPWKAYFSASCPFENFRFEIR